MKTTSSGAALGSSPASAGGRLNGKDFINIGIFTAIYFVIVFAVACLGFIPIFMVLICGIIPLVAGIPYMLYLTRVKKFGMITIMGLLVGIIMPMLLTADSYYATMRGQFGDAYVNELMGYLQPWAYPAMLIACFVTGIVGGFIGLKVLGKHFKRAGIA